MTQALYHYHATYLNSQGRSVVSSGSISLDRPLESTDDYDALVALLKRDLREPVASDFILKCLTRLN